MKLTVYLLLPRSAQGIYNAACIILFIFDHLFIFRIALRPSAAKELTSWLSTYAILLCVPFPFGVWGRMWNSIVSVPDQCLFIYTSK